jgi:hypothetical protein
LVGGPGIFDDVRHVLLLETVHAVISMEITAIQLP